MCLSVAQCRVRAPRPASSLLPTMATKTPPFHSPWPRAMMGTICTCANRGHDDRHPLVLKNGGTIESQRDVHSPDGRGTLSGERSPSPRRQVRCAALPSVLTLHGTSMVGLPPVLLQLRLISPLPIRFEFVDNCGNIPHCPDSRHKEHRELTTLTWSPSILGDPTAPASILRGTPPCNLFPCSPQ